METAAPLIRLNGVEKIFRSMRRGEVHALTKIDLHVGAGEFVAVVGPSGCGKTTLLRIIAGLVRSSAGETSVGGEAVSGPRRDVGVVFQAPALFAWKTVLENALLSAAVQRRDQRAATVRARELIQLVGLEGFENRYPHELSGGMQQRSAIVRALVHDPSILLLDEPFGSLDALTREHLNMLLQEVWLESRKTALLITHSITEAVFLADRVVVMSARPGRVLEIIPVTDPRPRSFSITSTEAFGRKVERIRSLLGPIEESGRLEGFDG